MKMIYRLLAVLLFGSGLAAAQVPGFFSSINANTGTIPAFNNVIYSVGYSTIENTVAACGTPPCQIVVSSSLTQSTSGTYTVPAGIFLKFTAGGSLALAGKTLSFSSTQGIVQAPPVNLGFGSGTITGLTGAVDVEWFGAIGDGVVSTGAGTDNGTSIQQTINSISSGWAQLQASTYKITGTLVVSKSTNGIVGTTFGYPNPTNLKLSILMETSSSADAIQCIGSIGSVLEWDTFRNFAIQRTVLPTSGSNGLFLSFAGGAVIDNVISNDSVRDFYFHAAYSYGIGRISNISGGWGQSVVGGYTTQTLYGVYLDSSDGNAENTIMIKQAAIANNSGVNTTTYGFYITGTHINDADIVDAEMAGDMTYGMYINYTGSGGFDSEADIIIDRPTFDECIIACIYITGLTSGATTGFPSVNIHDGYFEINATGTGIDIESSDGVSVHDNIFLGAFSGQKGVTVNNSNGSSVQGNRFVGTFAGQYAIGASGATNCIIAGNEIDADYSGGAIGTGVVLSNSTSNCVVSHNAITGYSNNVTNGYSVDSTSQNNQFNANAVNSQVVHPYAGFTSQATTIPGNLTLPGAVTSGTVSSGTLTDGTCSMHAGVLTGCTTAGATPRTCNSNGCYTISADGTYTAWGTVTITPGGSTPTATGSIVFPVTFPATPIVTITTVGLPSNADEDQPVGAQLLSTTTTGASAYFAKFIYAGAGGANINQNFQCNWTATY